MGPEVVNKNKNCVFNGPYAGRDLYITMFQDSEREFVVTHNANIKPVSYFTGRETELQELRRRIEAGRKSVLVSGMGGIGKTHICRKLFEEYLNKHVDDENVPFRHIGYVEYSGEIGSSLQSCLKYKEQDAPEKNQEAAWRELEYLASDGKLLLFVDNVDRPIEADSGLQRLKSIPGAVILTSRQASFGDEFEPYRIGFLGMEQCKEIYEKIRFESSGGKIKLEEVQDLEYVIENLAGRHTITVELLAHLARTKLWTVKRLREQLEAKGFQLEFHKHGELINIQKSYEALYDLSELTEAEQNILEAFSVFPYIPLQAEICNEWLLTDAGVDEDADILMGLYQKGWLQFDMNQESYALHPVFAQFIYEKCRSELENHLGLIGACRKCLKIPENGSVLECQKYIPFAESIVEKINMEKDLGQVGFIDDTAYILQYIAEYPKAKKLCEKILRMAERVLGETHPDMAIAYDHLAFVYKKQGKYKKAEELYEKSLLIKQKIPEEDDLSIARAYNNLAGTYESEEEYGKAEELYEKALLIREKILGEEHFDTATTYNDLAQLYCSQCKYIEAEELCVKALRSYEKTLGKEHPKTALVYNNLAAIYGEQGRYETAEKLYKKALRIYERVFGQNHPETAMSYNNLAVVYKGQGKYKKAEELYKKALQIYERVFGENYLGTATVCNNLAMVYEEQGEYKKAENLYKKSIWIREKVLGEENSDTARAYYNIAYMYGGKGEHKIAMSYYLKAYNILLFKMGINHPITQLVYRNFKITYYERNPKDNFEQWLSEQLREIRKTWFRVIRNETEI